MRTVEVCETFVSIQGESSFAGLPCFFIRLAGCNLRCDYCDTIHAYGPGRKTSIDELANTCADADTTICEITGGEPLLQQEFLILATSLRDKSGKTVLVETNGSRDISVVPDGVVTIMDVKCPGSGEHESFDAGNIGRLRKTDEVKFVIKDRRDYEFARGVVSANNLVDVCNAVFFNPVHGAPGSGELGGWVLADGLKVRVQVQLHKVLGMK
jgi:7-carboxy-7-deazaguanine synthase